MRGSSDSLRRTTSPSPTSTRVCSPSIKSFAWRILLWRQRVSPGTIRPLGSAISSPSGAYGSLTTNCRSDESVGKMSPPALLWAAVEPAAGPIQMPLDFCSSSIELTGLSTCKMYRDVAAGEAWQKRISLSTRFATTFSPTVTCMRAKTVGVSFAFNAASSASRTAPLRAPQKKPTEWLGALLIPRRRRVGPIEWEADSNVPSPPTVTTSSNGSRSGNGAKLS